MRRKILEEKFSEKKDLDNKIKIVEDLLGKKDINSYDKNKLTPLYNSLKYKDIDIIDMLLFLGAKKNVKVQGKYDILTYIAKENFENAMELYRYFYDKDYEYIFSPKVESPVEFSLKNRNRELTDMIINMKLMSDDYKSVETNPIDVCISTYQVKYFKLFLNKLDLNFLSDKFFEEIFKIILGLKLDDVLGKRKKDIMKKIYLRILTKKSEELVKKLKEIEQKPEEKNLDKKVKL